MKTFCTVLLCATLAGARDLQSNSSGPSNQNEQYLTFGDCIGLSPIIFGKEGAYVQSDIQFAQQVRDDFRDFDFSSKGDIIEDLSMDLMTRFFVRESAGPEEDPELVDLTMAASEIHLELGSYLT